MSLSTEGQEINLPWLFSCLDVCSQQANGVDDAAVNERVVGCEGSV